MYTPAPETKSITVVGIEEGHIPMGIKSQPRAGAKPSHTKMVAEAEVKDVHGVQLVVRYGVRQVLRAAVELNLGHALE
jgi:hypothetical protein